MRFNKTHFPPKQRKYWEFYSTMLIEVASFTMKKRIQGLTFLQLELHHPIKPWTLNPHCNIAPPVQTRNLGPKESLSRAVSATSRPVVSFGGNPTPTLIEILKWNRFHAFISPCTFALRFSDLHCFNMMVWTSCCVNMAAARAVLRLGQSAKVGKNAI